MLVDLWHARSAAYHAAWALSDGSDDPVLAASIAQALVRLRCNGLPSDYHPGPRRHQFSPVNCIRPQLFCKPCRHRRRPAGGAPKQHRFHDVAELVLDDAVAPQRRGESGHRTGMGGNMADGFRTR